jgi:hypothetical protein
MVTKCPTCGNRLWQVLLDNPSVVMKQCPKCGRSISDDNKNAQGKTRPSAAAHFETRTTSQPEAEVDTWPDPHSGNLPNPGEPLPEEEIPTWLSELEAEQRTNDSNEPIREEDDRFSDREREEAHKRMIQSHGLGVSVDSQGMRLTSPSTRRSKGSPELSPYDVVRLASELEGGVVPVEERIQCPACEAVVLPTDKICQWCSAPLA